MLHNHNKCRFVIESKIDRPAACIGLATVTLQGMVRFWPPSVFVTAVLFLVVATQTLDIAHADEEKMQTESASDDSSTHLVKLEAGLNLFGDPIGVVKLKAAMKAEQAQLEMARAVIALNTKLLIDYANLQNQKLECSKKVLELTSKLKSIPNDAQAAAVNLANVNMVMERLRPNLTLAPNGREAKRYWEHKAVAQGLTNYLQQLENLSRTIPLEVQGYETTIATLVNQESALQAEVQKFLGVLKGMGLSVTATLTESEVESILLELEVALAQNPNLLAVKAYQGYVLLHGGRYNLAIECLADVTTQLTTAASSVELEILGISLIGLAWAHAQENRYDEAAKALADFRKVVPPRSQSQHIKYEMLVCEAAISEAKGEYLSAYKTLGNARSVDANAPHAYRIASLLLLNSKIRSADQAVDLAKLAVAKDSKNDHRNYLALAKAYRASELPLDAKRAFEQAMNLVPEDLKDIVRKQWEEKP